MGLASTVRCTVRLGTRTMTTTWPPAAIDCGLHAPSPGLMTVGVREVVHKHLIDDDDGNNKEAQSHKPQVDNPQFDKIYY